MDRTVTGELSTAPASNGPTTFADSLPDELGETDPSVRKGIKWLVKRLGEPLCAEVLRETCEIEANGGLWLVRERRRRSKGGVFLTLLRTRSNEARRVVQRIRPYKPGPQAQGNEQAGKQPASEPFRWEQRGELMREARLHQGQAMTAKMMLMGRPGKVVEHNDFVVTSMESRSIPPLPKGLPVPSAPSITYTVFIAAKQWQKVKGPLSAPDDLLIVEGVCVPDAEAGGVAVLALSSTTRALQRQKNAVAKAAKGDPASPTLSSRPETRAPEIVRPPPPAAPLPSDEEQARALLRERIASGYTVETIAMRSGLPLNRLKEIHEGQATTLTPAQIRTFLQRLRQVFR